MTSRNLLLSGIPRDNLYTWRKFYDFDNEGKDVEWTEEADSGGTIVLSSGGGTGAIRLTTGSTLNDAVSIRTFQTSSFNEDYVQRVIEVAMRIHIHQTTTAKAVLCGWGYTSANYRDFISDGGLAVDWSGKEFIGFFAKAGDENWWVATSSNLDGTFNETRTNVKTNQYNPLSKQGWQTLRFVAQRDRGDVVYVKYFIDPIGYGDYAVVQDEFQKPITHIHNVEDSTSSATFATIKNATAIKERLWLDWWAINVPRSVIETDGAVP
jgi:hypothetical protein